MNFRKEAKYKTNASGYSSDFAWLGKREKHHHNEGVVFTITLAKG